MVNVNPTESTHFRVIQSDSAEEISSLTSLRAIGRADIAASEENDLQPTPAEINEPEIEALGAAAPPLPANDEIKQAEACLAQPVSKIDSPSRKKGKAVVSVILHT